MKRIFITGAGGAGTITAINNLKRHGGFHVISGDSNPYAYGLKISDQSYVLPAASDENYLNEVRGIIEKEKVDIYIPLVDEEILKAFDIREGFPGLKLLLPSKKFCEVALDKYDTAVKTSEYGITSPVTMLYEDFCRNEKYPVFVKPRTGRGSRNARLINAREELDAFTLLYKVDSKDLIFQENLDGEEYTVSVVVNAVNALFAIVPKKVIVKRGITLLAVTRYHSGIEKICRDILEKMEPRGPFNVQLKVLNGKPSIFEINPRYSTTLSLTTESGIDEVCILADRYDEKYTGDIMPFRENLLLSRHWESVFYEI